MNSPYLSVDDPGEEEVAEVRANLYLVRSSWYLCEHRQNPLYLSVPRSIVPRA